MADLPAVGRLVFACVRDADGLFPPAWRLGYVERLVEEGVWDSEDPDDDEQILDVGRVTIHVSLLDGTVLALAPEQVKIPRPPAVRAAARR